MSEDVLKFYCPNCNKKLGVRGEEIHLSFYCPKCARKIRFSEDARDVLYPTSTQNAPVSMQATTVVSPSLSQVAPIATHNPHVFIKKTNIASHAPVLPVTPPPAPAPVVEKIAPPPTPVLSNPISTPFSSAPEGSPKRKFLITKKSQ